MMTMTGISGDPKYRDAMLAKGETNGWELPSYQGRKYHADDQCIGQVWTELYFLYRENRMIEPMRAKMDFILANPPPEQSLDWLQGKHQDTWSWCDALFMAPPAWLRLYAATGDERYMNFAVSNFWYTTDFLYDKDEHLFFRDSSFFDKREANGSKVFWSRGNGWVFAGIIRILQCLPSNSPERPRFEQLFKDMAEKILASQQPDGMWRSSLLDPSDYPMPEASGSALFTYGLAWGVSQGLLDKSKYEPAVIKAWVALNNCVDADGKLTHIQPAGSGPAKFSRDSTQPYGSGVFLLAGSEVYRLAILENAKPITVTVTNPSDFRRDCETVEISPPTSLEASKQIAVMDGMSSRVLDSQIYDSLDAGKKLLFQVDLAPHETRTYDIIDASALPAVPQPIIKTFARYVPERYDDFAWESDRIAHRTYGLALIPAEGTISSGPDVWIKKNHELIVDPMYKNKHYHDDNGEYIDDYRVGNSRGCGGIGIWDGKKLYVSSNYRNWKLITTGPIRSEFELTYDAWDAGKGRKVSETKRISIDANSYFSKEQSTLTSDDKSALTIGVGLAERACGTNGEELISQDKTGRLDELLANRKTNRKDVLASRLFCRRIAWRSSQRISRICRIQKIHAEVPQPPTHEGAPPIR